MSQSNTLHCVFAPRLCQSGETHWFRCCLSASTGALEYPKKIPEMAINTNVTFTFYIILLCYVSPQFLLSFCILLCFPAFLYIECFFDFKYVFPGTYAPLVWLLTLLQLQRPHLALFPSDTFSFPSFSYIILDQISL